VSKIVMSFVLFALTTSSGFYLATAHPSTINSPETLIHSAMEKMGGGERFRSLKRIQLEGIGHTYFLEQSERPEGPWLVNYSQFTEIRDYPENRLRRTTQDTNIISPKGSPASVFVVADGAAAMQAGDRSFPASATQYAEAEEAMALSPERVLLTALDAKDLHNERDQSLQGSAQHVIGFTWRDATVRIFVSVDTEMPTAVEYVRSYPGSVFWGVWGDVTTRIYFSLWMLEPGGLRYPCQLDVERNGTPYQTFTVTALSLNPTLAADSFSIPSDVRKAYEINSRRTIEDLPLGSPAKPAVELAQGVVLIPGNWNVTLVRQPDGVVIIEAPISSGYSDKVIAEANRRFPGAPIKAVISTSDAWPHIGGAREYAARSIPIYALDLNKRILDRLIAAPHHSKPDALERARKVKPRFQIVSAKTEIGSGPNRLELYPIRSETGERMIMVYLPEHKLLYGSDLVQQLPDGSYFMPEYLLELMESVAREKLTVAKVFGMHTGLKPWGEIESAVSKVKSSVP